MLGHFFWRLRGVVGIIVLSALVGASAGAQSNNHPALELPVPTSNLTAEELSRAVLLGAPEALTLSVFSLRDKANGFTTVLSDVSTVDDNSPDTHLAIVTTYSYDQNETMRRLVDLERNEVIDEEITPGGAAPLAKVEKDFARALVLSDERIVERLGEDRSEVEIEMLLTSTEDPESEFFGNRVVLVIFETPRGYPQNLSKVFANLSASTVVILE